tara:strand:- start:316 stop:882 length:567 start_codon:yes stop_codon:yes gene_type:complete
MPWLIVALGYLLGCIPTAYIAGRLTKGRDIRQLGDGNMGAQNAFRELGAKIGVVVGIVDASKGAMAILIAQATNTHQVVILLAGSAVVIGHNWPVFLGFKGGRGESATIGVLLVLITQPMLLVGSIAVAVLFKTRNVIKASAVLFMPLVLACWWLGVSGLLVAYSIGLPCLIGFTHFLRTRRNLIRSA